MEFKDYYATLGVPKTATAKEIKQAFRKLARKYHPDVNQGNKQAETQFKAVNEAHEVLANPETRKKYDELGANWKMYEQAQATGGSGPFGRGPAGTYRTVTPDQAAELFGDNPFSEFFETFFRDGFDVETRGPRGTGGTRRRRPARGGDVEHDLELSLEDAFGGVTKRLAVSHGGAPKTVDVRIPAGVTDGSRVRVGGEGAPGIGGAPAGDLYLRIRLAAHPVFERKGKDLYVATPVTITTAVLGGEAEVKTPGGRTARLKIPGCTQNGQLFRLRGYGMPGAGQPSEPGDLYARVDVQLPRQLSAEQRRHYEALAHLSGPDVAAAGHTASEGKTS